MRPSSRIFTPQLLTLATDVASGGASWATAFTSVTPGWPLDLLGPSHLHRCFFSTADAYHEAAQVRWQVETQRLTLPRDPEARVIQGEARSLAMALGAALKAVFCPAEDRDRGTQDQWIGPAFLALERLRGKPRIWGCAVVTNDWKAKPEADSYLLQTCFIRERLGGHKTRFCCSVETVNQKNSMEMLSIRRWDARSLESAAASCQEAILEGRQAPGTQSLFENGHG
jgi:hypothetical protein